ncbi:hypothetical protein BIY45_00205 [Stenotrophomonas sp. BIIR7]|nr:hypothetical protein BIY45_00205 [Stenotrophomonas sp. BIIR7]
MPRLVRHRRYFVGRYCRLRMRVGSGRNDIVDRRRRLTRLHCWAHRGRFRIELFNFCDPPVTKTGHCTDHGLPVAGIVQCLACAAHGLGNHGVAYFCPPPHGGNQFIAAHRTLPVGHQIHQTLQRLERQRQALAVAAELA